MRIKGKKRRKKKVKPLEGYEESERRTGRYHSRSQIPRALGSDLPTHPSPPTARCYAEVGWTGWREGGWARASVKQKWIILMQRPAHNTFCLVLSRSLALSYPFTTRTLFGRDVCEWVWIKNQKRTLFFIFFLSGECWWSWGPGGRGQQIGVGEKETCQ